MSGFHSRGLVYIAARDYMADHVPGGLDAVTRALPGELASFLNQLFMANAMYEAVPVVAISEVAAALSGLPHSEYVRANAAWQAERDIRGVYKLLLNVMSAETVALRLPRVSMRYFDFGAASSSMNASNCCYAEQRGIPKPMASWFTACVHGFVPTALGIGGAKNVRVRSLATVADGQRQGLETVTLSYEFSWGEQRDRRHSAFPAARP